MIRILFWIHLWLALALWGSSLAAENTFPVDRDSIESSSTLSTPAGTAAAAGAGESRAGTGAGAGGELESNKKIVQKIRLETEKDCSLECYLNEKCVTWNYFDDDHSCYLQSEQLHNLMKEYNLSLPAKSKTRNLFFRHKKVISSPVAIGRSTVLNTQQSFIFGCSYTISLWAWIYKVPKSAGEMALFTTRESLPNFHQYQALLPSVVYNIGRHKNRLFFSTIKDSRNDYEGSWGKEIQFQKWIHIALSFSNEVMKYYINGEEFPSLIMTRQPEFINQRCPEDLHGENFTRTTDLLNNTIFQIGGSKSGTMLGMVQHVDIFQGATLTQPQIQKWMKHNSPIEFPTLDLLLQKYEGRLHRYASGTLSSAYTDTDEFSDYELCNYNICPRSLCGTMSLYGNKPHQSELEEVNESEEIDNSILLDEEIYFDEDNNVEFKVELIQENFPDASSSNNLQSSLKAQTDGSEIDLLKEEKLWKEYVETHDQNDYLEEMSDEEIDEIWSDLESGVLENRDEYVDILRQIRGSDLGDPYQDMSDEEVLEMWDAQVASIAKEYISNSKSLLDAQRRRTSSLEDDQISTDLGQEWQELSRSSQVFHLDKQVSIQNETDMKPSPQRNSSNSDIFTEKKFAETAERFVSAAELKLNLESLLRDPYYRRATSPMLQALVQEADQLVASEKNSSSRTSTIENLKAWTYVGFSQVSEYARTTLRHLRQNILGSIQTQLDFYGINITISKEEEGGKETVSERNNTKIRELTELLLSKLPNRGDFGPDQVVMITDWLENFLAKQTEAGEDGMATFAELLDSASFLIIDPSMLKDSNKTLPPSVAIVTELYDQSMLWYTGRHLIDSYSDTLDSSPVNSLSPADIAYQSHKNFDYLMEKYHREVHEPVQSALMYAMWLSDILELEYPDLADNTYFYQTMTGMLGQPIRLALGYRNGPNSIHDVNINIDIQESLERIISGSPEYLAIGRASSIELVQNSSTNTDTSTKGGEISSELLPEVTAATKQFLDVLTEDFDSYLFSPVKHFNTLGHLHFDDKFKESSNSLNPIPNHREDACIIAGSYYLPIMKYVTSHFGDVETGVGIPDSVILADLPSPDDIFTSMSTGGGGSTPGSRGMNSVLESSLREHYETEAAAGNPAAQMWMGIRSYWGTGGLSANSTNARKYFEMAAAQNHSEALFCLGALYENGQGGLSRNRTKALELFRLSASQKTPWPAALQALGSYHWNNGPVSERNETLAIQYFEKAAEMGHASGYYSLGLMYRENTLTVTKQNILLAVHLMARAASMGHVRAMTNLAHALFDTESWVGHYSRDQEFLNGQPPRNLKLKDRPIVSLENQTEVEVSMNGESVDPESNLISNLEAENDEEESEGESDIEKEENLLHRWGYNSTNGIQIILSATSEIIRFPQPLRPDCSVALPLMKYMAEHTYRPNDLVKSGLAAYKKGDLWEALELYEEAADLGISIAQENTAFLYQLVSDKYCPSSSASSSSQLWTKFQGSKLYQNFSEHYNHWVKSVELVVGSSFLNWNSGSAENELNSKLSDLNRLKYRGYDKLLRHPSCSEYFHDMALIRWIQLANSGDVEAIREMAQRYQGINPSQGLGQISSAQLANRPSSRLSVNETKAALLYAIAASEHGDISSIMSLGWYVQNGKAGVPKNLTLAKLLYEKAGELEAVYIKYGLSWATTKGVAPFLASSMASWELWLLQSHSYPSIDLGWLHGGDGSDFMKGDLTLVLLSGVLFIALGVVRCLRQRNNRTR